MLASVIEKDWTRLLIVSDEMGLENLDETLRVTGFIVIELVGDSLV